MAGFFADECIAGDMVAQLRRLELDVVSAREQCPGSPDTDVLRFAREDGRVLITYDLGFGDLAVRLGQPAVGIIILSLYALTSGVRERYGAERIRELGDRAVGQLVVIEPGRIRMRPLKLERRSSEEE